MKYTVEEVRAIAKRLHDDITVADGDALMASDMLNAYAERIKADAGVVTDEVVQKVADELDELFAVEDAQEPAFLNDVRRILTSVWPNPPVQAVQVDLQKVFDALHRSSPLPEIIRHVPGAERLHHEAHAMVRDALAAQSTAEPVTQGEAAATYQDTLRLLEARKCPSCRGSGKCDDMEPGDISYREWKCTSCDGSGFTAAPAQPNERVVDRWVGEIERCDTKGFWLVSADNCPFVPGQKVSITAAQQADR